MNLANDIEVAIIGAGPTGLALACVLAAKGVSFLLVDKLTEGANTSRAAVIHARTLEVLEELKITAQLHAEGHVVPRFTVRDRDKALATIRFEKLPTTYPHTLMVPQQRTEAIMLDRLRSLGGDVVRPLLLRELQHSDDAVILTLQSRNQTLHKVKARYVVGADGMHSSVRDLAGINFSGDSYQQSFVLADVKMDWSIRRDEVMLYFSPEGLVVVAPLPGNQYRIVATLDEAPEHPRLADIQQLLDTRGPVNDAAKVNEIIWSSRFRLHHRIADRFRLGRVFLAGDAAHTHSPAGGQGMNTGIQDAITLGHVLTAVICENANESLLDNYEKLRRPVAERVVRFTDRMTRMATLRHSKSRVLRNRVLGIVGRIPAFPRKLAMELSGLRNRALSERELIL